MSSSREKVYKMSYSESEKDYDPWASSYEANVPAYSFGTQPAAPQPSFAAPQPAFAAQPEAPQQAFEQGFSTQEPDTQAFQSAFPVPQPFFEAPQVVFPGPQTTQAVPLQGAPVDNPQTTPSQSETTTMLKTALRNCDLFKALDITHIEAIVEVMQQTSYKKDDVVTRQGTDAFEMYVLEHGELEVSLDGGDGKRQVIHKLTAGAFFGERALLSNTKRTVTVIALNDCTLWSINRSQFEKIMQNTNETESQETQSITNGDKLISDKAWLQFCGCVTTIFLIVLAILGATGHLDGPPRIFHIENMATSFVDGGSIDGMTRGICNGNYNYSVSSFGIIQSDNYPATYNPDATCTNQFNSEADGITFEFWSFSTENDFDFIVFRDSDGNNGQQCSGVLEGARFSVDSSRLPVSIYFQSDGSTEESGFSIAVSAGYDSSNDLNFGPCGWIDYSK